MRWWNELRDAALKCARVGHKLRRQWRTGYVEPRYRSMCVADRVRQERDFCTRCDQPQTEWEETSRMGINGLTASTETFDEIRAGGSWMDGGFEDIKAPPA